MLACGQFLEDGEYEQCFCRYVFYVRMISSILIFNNKKDPGKDV